MMPDTFIDSRRQLETAGQRESQPCTGRPRVAQLMLTLCPGGAEHLAIEMSLRLADRYGMPVICLDEPGPLAGRLQARNIDVAALRREPTFRPSLAVRIARMTRDAGIDVLHCQQYSPFVYGALATLVRPALKVIYTEHGRFSDAPPSLKRRVVNPWLARLPGAIYAVSDELRGHMLREGFPAHRVGVIHNGIDVGPVPGWADRERARRALGLTPGALTIGTAARLDPVKDLVGLVEAFRVVRNSRPEARLVIAGEGPERQAIRSRVMALGLDDSVIMAGYRADVRALLPALDVYVNSSISEGVSLTILEAMAAELPVVATAVGGTPEVVAHETTGVLVRARDAGSLSAGVLTLAAQPALRRAMGLAGRRAVEARFTMDRMVEDYASVYEQLA
jgi:glycosyltransferase involved in cell wall biosynthesis